MAVVAAGWRDIGQVDTEVLVTLRAVVMRVPHQQINGMTAGQVTEVVQPARYDLVTVRQVTAVRASCSLVVAAARHYLGCWQVLDVSNA